MITVVGKVRDVMGTDKELAIDDEQIITIIKIAENRIKKELFEYRYDVVPDGNPDTGDTWNGTNTSFTVDEPIMDNDFDRDATDDCEGYWLDSNYSVNTASVVVSNARYGRITIKQSNGIDPIPADAQNVYVSYYTADEYIPFAVMEDLGTLLTAHMISLRLTSPKKISMADLESNRRFLEIRPTMFYDEYKELIRNYKTTPILATS